MLLRRLGHSGLTVSRLGLGTLSWGSDVDAYTADELLETFLDAGGSLVETSPMYSDGRSEQVLGEVLAKSGRRDDVVLAGSCGLRRRHGEIVHDASRGGLLAQLDASLAALGTDHLDVWQVQRWDNATPLEETLATLEYAVRSGRVRYVGVGDCAAWQLAWAHTALGARADRLGMVSVQGEYSLLSRAIERDVAPAAEAFGVGVLARSPLGRGVLTAKYRTGTPADSRGAVAGWEAFVGVHLTPRAAAIVEAVVRAAEGLGCTPAHVALAWARDRAMVGSLVVGARTVDQLQENLAAEDVELPTQIHAALDDVSEAHR